MTDAQSRRIAQHKAQIAKANYMQRAGRWTCLEANLHRQYHEEQIARLTKAAEAI